MTSRLAALALTATLALAGCGSAPQSADQPPQDSAPAGSPTGSPAGTASPGASATDAQAMLAAHGLADVQVGEPELTGATRLDPDDPWVRFTLASLERSTGRAPVLLPNLGGSLPNDVFADILGLPTVWIPHSYAGCRQHAPDEHLLAPVAREALQLMCGLFWDLAEQAGTLPRRG